MAWYSAGLVFEVCASKAMRCGSMRSSIGKGRSSAHMTLSSRANALSYAALGETPVRGLMGVMSEISSRTPSNTTITVGRIMMASGTPSASGFGSGSRSMSRTMS
jgi:hypothetical protein